MAKFPSRLDSLDSVSKSVIFCNWIHTNSVYFSDLIYAFRDGFNGLVDSEADFSRFHLTGVSILAKYIQNFLPGWKRVAEKANDRMVEYCAQQLLHLPKRAKASKLHEKVNKGKRKGIVGNLSKSSGTALEDLLNQAIISAQVDSSHVDQRALTEFSTERNDAFASEVDIAKRARDLGLD